MLGADLEPIEGGNAVSAHDGAGPEDTSRPLGAAADVPPAGQHPWHRYIALGDSLTEGLGDPDPRSVGGHRGWADRTAEELGATQQGFSYANLAVRGLLLDQVIDSQLAPAMALHPDLVSFQAGGNDIIHPGSDPDKLAATLDPAIAELASSGATVVLFVGPDSGPSTVLGRFRNKIAIFNENLRTIAAQHGAVVADMWALSRLSDPQMWDEDRLHLSPLGHHTVAAMVLDALNVEHSLQPLFPLPHPPQSWRQARSEDLVWTRDYLVPWVLRGIARHPISGGVAPKRPDPGPIAGSERGLR